MFLSIIVPVYNLERYIRKCVDSCLAQGFDDYEILLVDDGSTDESSAILDSYAEKHPERIKVVHKENGGVSSARNVGIEQASGEWIWFVDGDDWIAPDCLAPIAEQLRSKAGVLLNIDAELVYDTAIPPASVSIPPIEHKAFVDIENSRGAVWAYWYKRHIIIDNGLRFNQEMKYLEDSCFALEYMQFCDREMILQAKVYAYYQRPDSAMHTMDHQKRALCMKQLIEACSRCAEHTEDRDKQRQYHTKRLGYVMMLLLDVFVYSQDYDSVKREIEELVEKGCYPYKRSEYVRGNGRTKKEKAATFLYKNVFPYKWLYLVACRIRMWIR